MPLLDRVLVEKLQAASKTSGGILLPEAALSKVAIFPVHSSDASRDG